MADTSELPRELQVALSYLDDIDSQIDNIKTEHDNVLIRARMAQKVQQGDLLLSNRELDKLATQGIDVRLARAQVFFKEGRLAFAVAASGGVDTGDQDKWFKKAVEAYEKSIQLDETAEAYYNLGICFINLKRTTSAIQALSKVEQMDDGQLSIEATKEIRRLDPNGRIGSSITASASNTPGGQVMAAPGKKPNWTMLRNGVIALVVGIVLSGAVIGIPIALVGLGMIIWAFAVGVPT